MSESMLPLDDEAQKKRVVSVFSCIMSAGQASSIIPSEWMLTSVLFLRLGHRGLPLWPWTSVCIPFTAWLRERV